MRTIVGFVAAFLVVLTGCSKSDPSVEDPDHRAKLSEGDMVTVVGVVKGDEVRVQADGRTARLRLVGLYSMDEAVSAQDPAAAEALAASLLKSEIVGHVVRLHLSSPPEDGHGRYLGFLDASGTDLSLSLLEGGRVVVYTEFPFDRESLYLGAERGARAGKRGLWRHTDLSGTIKGLRKQWAEERAKRSAPPADDPLLAPEPAPEPAPAPTP